MQYNCNIVIFAANFGAITLILRCNNTVTLQRNRHQNETFLVIFVILES